MTKYRRAQPSWRILTGMKIIDRLLKDYDRRCYMVFLAVMILLIIEMFYDSIFGYYLTQCHNTAEVLEFLKIDALQKCFFGRAVFSYMRYIDSFSGIIAVIGKSVDLKDIVTIILSIAILFPGEKPEFYGTYRKNLIIFWIMIIAKAAFFAGMIFYAFTSGDTAQGLNRLLVGAYVFEYASIVLIVAMLTVSLLYFYRVYLES